MRVAKNDTPGDVVHYRLVRRTAVIVVAALVSAGIAGCTPPTPPTPPDPTNIANMTDAQVDAVLTDAVPEIRAAMADRTLMAKVPAEYQSEVTRIAGLLETASGRAQLTVELRADAATTRGGFSTAKEKFAGGVVADVVGLSVGDVETPTLSGTRSPAPPTTGASVPYQTLSGNCSAPGGTRPDAVSAPADLVPNQFLTPEHDVFAKFTSSFNGVTLLSSLAPAGETTINGTSGVEFRGSRSSWQVRVRVDIEDVNKGYPLRALYPIFHRRPLGGTAAQETQVFPVEGNLYCYANDPVGSKRGYFDGWVPIGTAEPGYQLIAEVVENDYYFRIDGEDFQPFLNAGGPQFFAGADRSTVHIGRDPLFSSSAITHSVGAFATASPDPGNGAPNALTDTNNDPADDVEAPIRNLLESKVVSGLSDELDGVLSNYYAFTVWGSNAERPKATVDLKFVDPHTAFPDVTDEPDGFVGAIEANITGEGHADVGMQVLGTPCFGLTLDVAFSSKANIWADSAGPNTGIVPRFKVKTNADTNLDMPWYNWGTLTCQFGFFLVAASAPGKVESGVNKSLDGALGKDGSITQLMSGLDLDDFLPTLTIDPVSLANTTTGGAMLRPHVANLDNAWCGATGAPAGCTGDQSLIGARGPEIVADASLGSDDVRPIGGPIGGRFRNVFVPTTSTKIEDLVTSHKDGEGVTAGLGVVVDPSLINMALRALAQGPALGTTTNGLIDIANLKLPISGYSVTTRPEVAPMVVGYPGVDSSYSSFAHAVAPDVRLALKTSTTDPKTINYSAAATVNVGLTFNPIARSVKPVLDSPIIDLQVTGGCQVNYVSAYAASYLFCGRGSGGNGGSGISTVTDLLDEFANFVVAPVINDTVGSIGLPSLDGLLPGAHLALANVRFNQRGGNLAVYADVAKMPRISLVGRSAGYGGQDDTIRFFAFPTNVNLADPSTVYTWGITDAVTGQAVPFTFVAGAGESAVQFPSRAFAVNNSVDKRKTVNGKLSIDQTLLHVEGTGTFSWMPPSAVPPPNCPPTSGSFLQQLPGGVGGYGSIGLTTC